MNIKNSSLVKADGNGGRRLSTKTLHEPKRPSLRYCDTPWGDGIRKTDFGVFGKQKNFNIFSFPVSFDADNVFLAWQRGNGSGSW